MAVSEQCLSPDNRFSHVHARNSSKTLKCPKCNFIVSLSIRWMLSLICLGNWHYKYQETLEIHMKEKHPLVSSVAGHATDANEGEKTCSYCLSNSVHPRLARGEQYPCGFKPYRCDLCLYSTTTKGNLAIHMQSDKHMNNCRDFSSNSVIPTFACSTSVSSPDISLDQTSPSQGLSSFHISSVRTLQEVSRSSHVFARRSAG